MMADLNPVIHAPLRLRICSLLSSVDQVEFSTIRRHLDVADSVLSKHLATLEEAGYVSLAKGSIDARRTTWISLSSAGRKALRQHLRALQELIDAADRASPRRTPRS